MDGIYYRESDSGIVLWEAGQVEAREAMQGFPTMLFVMEEVSV